MMSSSVLALFQFRDVAWDIAQHACDERRSMGKQGFVDVF
jgi:hypothetical protein